MSDFWQTVLQHILTPTLIVGALAFVLREVFKSYLSIDIERYKASLQADLENHKAKLKAEYDSRHFEFETRFSTIHLKRVEVTEKLFELLADVHNDSQKLASWDSLQFSQKWRGEPNLDESEFLKCATKKLQELGEYYDRKRLYIDGDIQTQIVSLVRSWWNVFDSTSFSDSMREPLKNLLNGNMIPLMNDIERAFKKQLCRRTPRTQPSNSKRSVTADNAPKA